MYERLTRQVPGFDVAEFEDWSIATILYHFLEDERETYEKDREKSRVRLQRALLWSRGFKAIEAGGHISGNHVIAPNPYKGAKEKLV